MCACVCQGGWRMMRIEVGQDDTTEQANEQIDLREKGTDRQTSKVALVPSHPRLVRGEERQAESTKNRLAVCPILSPLSQGNEAVAWVSV